MEIWGSFADTHGSLADIRAVFCRYMEALLWMYGGSFVDL